MALVMCSAIIVTLAEVTIAEPQRPSEVVRVFEFRASIYGQDAIGVTIVPGTYDELANGPVRRSIEFPIGTNKSVRLALERFDVVAPDARFVSWRAAGPHSTPPPDVVLFRGQVTDQPQSRAFLAFSASGISNGYVLLEDRRRFVLGGSRSPDRSETLIIHRELGRAAVPDFTKVCGLDTSRIRIQPLSPGAARSAPLLGAPQLAFVAIDADQEYVQLFPDEAAAQAYIVQLIGAVSDIYIRDLDVKLILSFARTWPDGGEPFGANSLNSFAQYWNTNENPSLYNIIHMLSGSRATAYGGVAFLADPCTGGAYSISAFLLGGFPIPVDGPDLGNWDITVVAHEMGHNMGTPHTHDYDPPIDECAFGTWARSDIMSYCHTRAGGLLNIDPRFHARIQDLIAANVASVGCLSFDCNGNNQSDQTDIATLSSLDVNGNGVPDECEDCNGNGTLDTVDIAGGAPDVNGNSIPDACESDCNSNGTPDEFEITNALLPDANGNLVPDVCEPDCDGNGVADHADIAAGALLDVDRSSVPDACEDCNGNGIEDYVDVDRQFNPFLVERQGFVREYHQASGVAIRNLAEGIVQDGYDLTFGPDRQLYVASFGNDSVIRIDVDSGEASVFIPPGTGGLVGPAGLTFGPTGWLYVSNNGTDSVLEFDGESGAFRQTFVPAGTGLTGPYNLIFGPNGNLFVSDASNAVLEFEGTNGAFVRTFVITGSGGLIAPRGLVFTLDGRLLVAGSGSHRIYEYDENGAFTRLFSGGFLPTGAWGLRIGPNGNVFVVRSTGDIRIVEYDVDSGIYIRSYIRGDSPPLMSPTGIAFRPASPNDCNANGKPDDCDGIRGTVQDCQPNGIPDQCDLDNGTSQDCQPNGTPDECDIAGGVSLDENANGIPDDCECTPGVYADIEPSPNGDGDIDIDDILCVLDVFRGVLSSATCNTSLNGPGDLEPCGGDGDADIDDILAVLDAFVGVFACPPPCY